MSTPIQAIDTGVAPYGLIQVEYLLPGSSEGLTLDALIREVGLQRSAVLEKSLTALSDAIQHHREKIDALSWAVAFCSEIMVETLNSDTKTSTMIYEAGFTTVLQTLKTYDVPECDYFKYSDKERCYGISVGDLQLEYEELSFAIEQENNALECAMVDLQSLLAKRDSSFEQAAVLSQKLSRSRSVTLHNC
ncbi:MAG: hypothetical protein IJV69_05485 [Kiritimatiellae bacterium]|nr:hypothetical protein [Kiritimatiellia bacterium]